MIAKGSARFFSMVRVNPADEEGDEIRSEDEEDQRLTEHNSQFPRVFCRYIPSQSSSSAFDAAVGVGFMKTFCPRVFLKRL